ncbi:MAG: hypothetical protein ACT4NL_02970 [Pseudomarimonas sp.]
MKTHILLAAILGVFSLSAQANLMGPAEPSTLEERANARAAGITDAEAFVQEIDQTLELARAGDYGRLKRGDISRMNRARDVIAELLEGHGSALELPPEERIDLYNAQETLTAAIRNDDKNRKVCKLEAVTGSRLAKTECMTVAEREERALRAREETEEQIRTICIPGVEGNPC